MPPELDLAITYVPLLSLSEYSNNPRTHSPEQIQQVAESIKAFGFISPIIVDPAGEVIAGHGRRAAAKLLVLKHVPVVCLDHLSDAQKKALRIADNRLAELAGRVKNRLAIEFSSLVEMGAECDLNFELEITGFSYAAIDRTIEAAKKGKASDPDDDFESGGTDRPVSRLGDRWLLDDHAIICGDARDHEDHERVMGGQLAQTAMSDPPYNVKGDGHISGHGKIVHPDFIMAAGEMTEAQFTWFLTDFLRAVLNSLVQGAVLFLFMDWRDQREVLDAARSAGLTPLNFCVWDKGTGGMGSLYRSQHELVYVFKKGNARHKNRVEIGMHGCTRTKVWNYPGLASFGRGRLEQLAYHPTPKNCAMIADAIRDVSDRNDKVIDPFSGSGTTIIAAAKTRRCARVIELDPKYVDVSVRRWEDWSGKEARRADPGLTFVKQAARRAGNSNQRPTLFPNQGLSQTPEQDRKRMHVA